MSFKTTNLINLIIKNFHIKNFLLMIVSLNVFLEKL